ncbi:MAG: hypothetical protein IIY94_02430 [Oscillospiraceae bacterium]|nr:hypothetical protein [Oscillospiraceae bacterium]
MLKKIYLGLCILLDLAALLFFGGVAVFAPPHGKELLFLLSWLATTLLLTVTTFCLLHRYRKKKEGKLFRNATLMKLSVFFTGSAFSYFGIDNDGAMIAFSFFLFFGLLFAAITVFKIRYKPRPRMSKPSNYALSLLSFKYKGKWAWETAATEYRRLHRLPADAELSAEESNKIFDYTAVPFSYFFYWLADSGFINEEITENLPWFSVEKMRTREYTPVELLASLDYYFDDEYLSKDVLPFLRAYYNDPDIFTNTECYLFDYYDAIGNPEDRYYCVDFSWDVLERLCARIEQRYQTWKQLNFARFDEGQDDSPFVPAVHSALFDTDLKAYRIGARYQNYSDNDTSAYLASCIHCLDSLPQAQLEKLEQQLENADYYGIWRAPVVLCLHFHPDFIHIWEPQRAGDIVFTLSGKADFEPEHGISFTVRNGLILDWGFSYDFENPYCSKLVERFEALSSIDFTNVRSPMDAIRCLSSGELIRTELLPDIPGCISQYEDDYVYLTPRALEKKQQFEKCIRNIRAYSGMFDLEIVYSPEFATDAEHAPLSVVPKTICIQSKDPRKWVKIFFRIDVWY